jgi:hypothetical protein
MNIIYQVHSILGERVLPILIVIAAIWLTVAWRPGAQPGVVARLFPVLVDIQVTLGLVFLVYQLVVGAGARYLSFPFLLHPILGLFSAGIAHMAVKPDGPARRLGRWAPLATLVVLLLIVIGNVMLARAV